MEDLNLKEALAEAVEALAEREESSVGHDISRTLGALAVIQRLSALAKDVQFVDYQSGSGQESFPQFEMSLGSSFVHGGAEGVRNDEQYARIKPAEAVEVESLLGLLCVQECRRRKEKQK